MRADPIILLGMHRSGTSLAAEMLTRLGVLMGRELPYHHEPLFFVFANEWILQAAHAAWDEPEPVRHLLDNPEARAAVERALARKVRSHSFARHYVGLSRLWRFHHDAGFPWGWKEPRTTATFPLWHTVFPQSRYIFVSRNGVDVAASLRAREQANRAGLPAEVRHPGRARTASLRCLDLDEAYTLWEEYNQLLLQNRKRVGEVPWHSFRYEDFLAKPAETLEALCAFLKINPGQNRISEACRDIRPERAFAFLGDPQLEALYTRVKDRPSMRQYGYDRIGAPGA